MSQQDQQPTAPVYPLLYPQPQPGQPYVIASAPHQQPQLPQSPPVFAYYTQVRTPSIPTTADDKHEIKEQLLPKSCGSTVRELGDFSHFLFGLVFGTLLPFFSAIITWGFESSQLGRLGVLYGTADFFLLLGYLLIRGFWCTHAAHYKWALLSTGIVSVILALILLGVSCKKLWCYLNAYETDSGKHMTVVTSVGCRRARCLSCFCTIIFPLAALRVFCCHTSLNSKYGTLKGLGWLLFIGGLCIHHHFVLLSLLGLYLIQVSNVHFRMALISAGESVQSMMCCRQQYKACALKRTCGNSGQCSVQVN